MSMRLCISTRHVVAFGLALLGVGLSDAFADCAFTDIVVSGTIAKDGIAEDGSMSPISIPLPGAKEDEVYVQIGRTAKNEIFATFLRRSASGVAKPFSGPTYMLDFDQEGLQQGDPMFVVQPVSTSPISSQSLVSISIAGLELADRTTLTAKTIGVREIQCMKTESRVSSREVNGTDDATMMNGVFNVPEGYLYEQK